MTQMEILCKNVLQHQIDILAAPTGVDLDEQSERIFVSSFGTNSIVIFDFGCNLGATWTTEGSGGFNNPAGLLRDPESGRIFVADRHDNSVNTLSPDGVAIFEITTLGNSIGAGELRSPRDVAMERSGEFILDVSSLWILTVEC